MQTADVLVALNGDRGNTVPKTGVTVAEIAVLMQIHGDDAIHEIKPGKDVKVSTTDEIERLRTTYGRARDPDGRPLIDYVYPGRAPQLHTKLADLELPDELFVATGRNTPKAKSRPAKKDKEEIEPVTDDGLLG